MILWKTAFENIVGNGEKASNQHFLLFPHYLLPYLGQIYSFRLLTTLDHTIPTFNDFDKEAFWKHCEKKRKCFSQAFSPFPTMFSTIPKVNFNFHVILISSSAFISHEFKILLFGIELISHLQMLSITTSPKFVSFHKKLPLYQRTKSLTFPN